MVLTSLIQRKNNNSSRCSDQVFIARLRKRNNLTRVTRTTSRLECHCLKYPFHPESTVCRIKAKTKTRTDAIGGKFPEDRSISNNGQYVFPETTSGSIYIDVLNKVVFEDATRFIYNVKGIVIFPIREVKSHRELLYELIRVLFIDN